MTVVACSIDGCTSPAKARGWCSRHWALWRRHGDPLGALFVRTCGGCDQPFATRNPRRFYHDAECRHAAHQIRHDMQRALRDGATVAVPVDRRVVWKRDDGICGVCGKPADEATWQLDHVIGLAAGGEHTYENTRVSCADCNQHRRRPRKKAAA